MVFGNSHNLSVGTKVRINEPTDIPEWSKWDDDKGRTSATLKKRLQAKFFQGNRKITAEVLYIGKESEREKLRRQGRVKLRLRDASGSMLNITADPAKLVAVN